MLNDLRVFVSIIIEHLHFKTGMISSFVFRIFLNIKYNAAVTACINLPLKTKMIIFIFLIGNKIATTNRGIAFLFLWIKTYCSIAYYPGSAIGCIVINMP